MSLPPISELRRLAERLVGRVASDADIAAADEAFRSGALRFDGQRNVIIFGSVQNATLSTGDSATISVPNEVALSIQRSYSYQKYLASLAVDLDHYFPAPHHLFPVTLACMGANSRVAVAHDLLDIASKERRVVVSGAAGGGKSFLLARLARDAFSRGVAVIVLDFKQHWSPESSTAIDLVAPLRHDDSLDIVLRAALADLTLAKLRSFAPDRSHFFLVDGLNEIPADLTRKVILILEEQLRQSADAHILVSDRIVSRPELSTPAWQECRLNPLLLTEAATCIDERFGPASFSRLSASSQAVLQTPYFLDLALRSESPDLGSKSLALEDFFRSRVRASDADLDLLAEAATDAYRTARATAFTVEPFKANIGDLWDRLLQAGILNQLEHDQVQFSHQLQHDYLASRRLAQLAPEQWNSIAFDAVTLQTQSYDAIAMAAERLEATGEIARGTPPVSGPLSGASLAADSMGVALQLSTRALLTRADLFLERVYDWDWLAALEAMAEAVRSKNVRHSPEMETAVLAVIAAKTLDPVLETRRRARDALAKYPGGRASHYQEVDTLADIVLAVSAEVSSAPWFVTWTSIFGRLVEPLTENEIYSICDSNSLIGWTASNVIRRFPITPAVSLQLRTIYELSRSRSPHNDAVRWRVVHALGMSESLEDAAFLLRALEGDQYHWSQYGAARSLVEMAARTEAEPRSFIKDELIRRGASLPSQAQKAIGRAVFYPTSSHEWYMIGCALLEVIRDAQRSQVERSRWEKRLEEFIKFRGMA